MTKPSPDSAHAPSVETDSTGASVDSSVSAADLRQGRLIVISVSVFLPSMAVLHVVLGIVLSGSVAPGAIVLLVAAVSVVTFLYRGFLWSRSAAAFLLALPPVFMFPLLLQYVMEGKMGPALVIALAAIVYCISLVIVLSAPSLKAFMLHQRNR